MYVSYFCQFPPLNQVQVTRNHSLGVSVTCEGTQKIGILRREGRSTWGCEGRVRLQRCYLNFIHHGPYIEKTAFVSVYDCKQSHPSIFIGAMGIYRLLFPFLRPLVPVVHTCYFDRDCRASTQLSFFSLVSLQFCFG